MTRALSNLGSVSASRSVHSGRFYCIFTASSMHDFGYKVIAIIPHGDGRFCPFNPIDRSILSK